RLLAKKIPGGEQRNRRFFATLGKHGELCPASLKIKHSVGWAFLGKENLLCRVIPDASSWPFGREKSSSIKEALVHFTHLDGLFLSSVVWSQIIFISASWGRRRGHRSVPEHTTLR